MSGGHWNRAGRRSGGDRPASIPVRKIDHDFPMYAIFSDPKDFPGMFVVRRFVCQKDNPEPVPDEKPFAVTTTLEEARATLPMGTGLMRFPRDPRDEPQIVETWL